MKNRGISLRFGLLAIVTLCWVLPILAILAISAYFVSNNFQSRLEETVLTSVDKAAESVRGRVESVMAASRAVSYDGTVRGAYLEYCATGDSVALYSDVNAYLYAKFAFDDSFTAAFLYFTKEPDIQYYVNNRSHSEVGVRKDFERDALPKVRALSEGLGTGIAFLRVNGRLYLVRNIVDSSFQPYAVLALDCSLESLCESVYNIVWLQAAALEIDGLAFPLTGGGVAAGGEGFYYDAGAGSYTVCRSPSLSGHQLTVRAICDGQDLFEAFPNLRAMAVVAFALVIPLLAFVIWAFYRYVSLPVNRLVEASERVETGELGYTVEAMPRSLEFLYVTEHFNSMSEKLKRMFDHSRMEQIALQDARIKALQSQINPHFLNNTLEIINWEARMAKDDKVSSMIEALSTMLAAATARDGRAMVSLREELTYVDAYLYIISQRFGERLRVIKRIGEGLLDAPVPRLILQPIVENAIEHGISQLPTGELVLRAYRAGEWLCLEVEQDGRISDGDRENIARLLNSEEDSAPYPQGRLGIRNVNIRLKMLFGKESGLSITEVGPERIRARIRLPYAAPGRD